MNKSEYMRTRILLTLTILIPLILPAQGPSYNIRFNIKNFPDSVSYLAQYHGDRILSKDTAEVSSGKFTFTGEKQLKAGMYVVAGEATLKLLISSSVMTAISESGLMQPTL